MVRNCRCSRNSSKPSECAWPFVYFAAPWRTGTHTGGIFLFVEQSTKQYFKLQAAKHSVIVFLPSDYWVIKEVTKQLFILDGMSYAKRDLERVGEPLVSRVRDIGLWDRLRNTFEDGGEWISKVYLAKEDAGWVGEDVHWRGSVTCWIIYSSSSWFINQETLYCCLECNGGMGPLIELREDLANFLVSCREQTFYSSRCCSWPQRRWLCRWGWSQPNYWVFIIISLKASNFPWRIFFEWCRYHARGIYMSLDCRGKINAQLLHDVKILDSQCGIREQYSRPVISHTSTLLISPSSISHFS